MMGTKLQIDTSLYKRWDDNSSMSYEYILYDNLAFSIKIWTHKIGGMLVGWHEKLQVNI